jgi:hypothetical protein
MLYICDRDRNGLVFVVISKIHLFDSHIFLGEFLFVRR